ncbi:MAG: sodium-dependent transporter [Pseudomonadota bacterium]
MSLSPTRTESRHGMWSSRWLFILAAAGSAVGLGNIWKFPYVAGDNGGGAFVVIYLLCVAIIGVPIMIAETFMGRAGRQSPINTMRHLVKESNAGGFWTLIGWLGVITGFLIVTYYPVIAGWALNYVRLLATGALEGVTAEQAEGLFNAFLADPLQLSLWHTLFMFLMVWIVAGGVSKGIERAVRWFMPLLFILLLVLLGYAVTAGDFQAGVDFMIGFDWSKITVDGWLVAMGQAFFTLSLGMGAIMAYGAYVPGDAKIGTTVFMIAGLDTLVAVLAGLAIFPIVFANGLEPGQGPGLMFVTVPLAFGQMALGTLFGTLFFLLVTFAAVTSAISLMEPALAYLVEEYNAKRGRVAISLGVLSWLIGIGSVLSFNYWSDVHIVGSMTFFDALDYVTQNIMLPLCGLLIALFAGFVLPRRITQEQLGIDGGVWWFLWSLLIKVVAPVGVLAVFVYTLYGTFA